MREIKQLYNPESIVFITSLSACINTLLFVSALGISILDASIIGFFNLFFIVTAIIVIALIIAWFEKQNSHFHQSIYKNLTNIESKTDLSFSESMQQRFNNIYRDNDTEWRPTILLFINFTGDVLVFTTLVSVLSYAFISHTILLEFSYQLFVVLLSTLVSLILCCFRSYNYDIQSENRKVICEKADQILNRSTKIAKPIPQPTLTNGEYFFGLLLSGLLSLLSLFAIHELIHLQDTHLFSPELLNILNMVQHYVTGYSILASLAVGLICFRIFSSIKLQSPDWQLINTFINIISTYLVLLISAKRFIFIFATLFSLPISASTIALANFLIPVVASFASLVHAYAFYTYFRHDRELSLCVDEMLKTPSTELSDKKMDLSAVNTTANGPIHPAAEGVRRSCKI